MGGAIKMEIFQLFQERQVGDTIKCLVIVEEDCTNFSATFSKPVMSYRQKCTHG